MTFEDFQQHKRIALFAAVIANAVRDRINDGYGPPDDTTMLRFIEEAEAVVDIYEEANDKLVVQRVGR